MAVALFIPVHSWFRSPAPGVTVHIWQVQVVASAKYLLRQFRFKALALDGCALEFCHDSFGVF